MALRIHDRQSQRHFILEAEEVYADLDGDGRISQRDVVPAEPRLLEAAHYFNTHCDPRIPGLLGPDGTTVCGARLNRVEQVEFAGSGTAAVRNLLEEHLSFFDPGGTGRISWADNYRGWRALGFGRLKSLIQTLGAALIFGWRQGGTIVINRIGRSRPSRASGLYAPDGNLDRAMWARYQAAFEAVAQEGWLSLDQARQVMFEQSSGLGRIPRRQFESLYALCARMNGADTISIEQIGWLYDGSLLWRAATRIVDSIQSVVRTNSSS